MKNVLNKDCDFLSVKPAYCINPDPCSDSEYGSKTAYTTIQREYSVWCPAAVHEPGLDERATGTFETRCSSRGIGPGTDVLQEALDLDHEEPVIK